MLIVTLATESDLPRVLALDAECFPPGRPDLQPANSGELESGVEGSRIILARLGRETIGFLHSEFTEDGALEIVCLAVAERYRRQGVGRALLNHCLATALDAAGRLPEIVVLTSPLNEAMLGLLFQHGFVGRSIRRDYFGPGRHRLACYLTDVRPRTGAIAMVPLPELFDVLADGRHLILNVRRNGDRSGTRYGVAPVAGPGHPVRGRGSGPADGSGNDAGAARGAIHSSMPTTPDAPIGPITRNEDAPWERFDPEAYYDNNYRSLREDDRTILSKVGQFFSEYYADFQMRRPAYALDIGSGANLYPALAMLPWCTHLTLADHSPLNRPWLEQAVDGPGGGPAWSWAPFWQVLSEFAGYDSVDEPEQQFVRLHRTGRLAVEDLDILDLPAGRRWDLGTMFFVAESITEDYLQFTDAIKNFLGALRPGSPFAAAFMVGSGGYPVKGVRFPAVKTDADDIVAQFAGRVARWRRHDVPKAETLLRDHGDDNYDGMLLLVGVTRHS